MGSRFSEIDLGKIRTHTQKQRKNKVEISHLARTFNPFDPFSKFLETLPLQLKSQDLKEFSRKVAKAWKNKSAVVFMAGGHVVKCGLSPLILDLARRGIITHLAMNGSTAFHDLELAYFGATSEDVAKNLENGSFGMAKDSPEIFNSAVTHGNENGHGFGESIGEEILKSRAPFKDKSLLAGFLKLGLPVTVHVALGTDVVHQHPSASGEAIGETSLRDFRILCNSLKTIEGGVVINAGSAVILPEVFLKALTVVRNLGIMAKNFCTADFDMIRHYRPEENVVRRPVLAGDGKGYSFTGHHEIMIPLFYGTILYYLELEEVR